jgi:glycosyltransferase involved in cell wall biosynthesis
MPLWALARLLEPLTEFNHVVGAVDAWHQLRVLGRRPIVMTVAIEGPPLGRELYDKVSTFVAESRPLADALIRAGVAASRVEIVYPGVDLSRFHPVPRPDDQFRVLFASSPASPADIERRGIPLMIEAARCCPEIELVLLWRRWGNVDACVRALDRLNPPANVRIEVRDVTDMAAVFHTVHATMFLPAEGHGKSAPNSVIEGLASGCGAVLSQGCGIADLVRVHRAGVVIDRGDVDSVARALRELHARREELSINARALAERHFSERLFLERYGEIYGRVARRRVRAVGGDADRLAV